MNLTKYNDDELKAELARREAQRNQCEIQERPKRFEVFASLVQDLEAKSRFAASCGWESDSYEWALFRLLGYEYKLTYRVECSGFGNLVAIDNKLLVSTEALKTLRDALDPVLLTASPELEAAVASLVELLDEYEGVIKAD